MATYYVTCVTKHPTKDDPHTRIQYIGTTLVIGTARTKLWPTDMVISAIERGDTFYCRDKRGDQVTLEVALHNGNKYVKTTNDGIKQDNLLSQPSC